MPQASAAWSAPSVPEEHLVDAATLAIPPKPARAEIFGVDGAELDPLAYAEPAVHELIRSAQAAADGRYDEADANANVRRLSPGTAFAFTSVVSLGLWAAIVAGVWAIVA